MISLLSWFGLVFVLLVVMEIGRVPVAYYDQFGVYPSIRDHLTLRDTLYNVKVMLVSVVSFSVFFCVFGVVVLVTL